MKANSIEEYFGTLQAAMVESWKSHLKTNKYSKHIALNEFYDDVVDLVDDLIEEYQGLHGVVEDLKNVLTTDKMDARDYLEELRELTESGKELMEESELHSDIDSILSLIDKTLYKLKELTEERTFKSLSEYLTEKLLIESVSVADARKIVFDILQKKAEDFDVEVDKRKLQDLANAIVDICQEDGELDRDKNKFEKFLSDDDYFVILSIADTNMDKDDHDLMYKIFGESEL